MSCGEQLIRKWASSRSSRQDSTYWKLRIVFALSRYGGNRADVRRLKGRLPAAEVEVTIEFRQL